jgi:hypothetical protein
MDKTLKTMAEALAASIPPHLGKPTVPAIAWKQEGETVFVILADGRKVSASIQAINALMFTPAHVSSKEEAPAKTDLNALDAVDLKPAAKTKPAASGGKGKGKAKALPTIKPGRA